MAPTLLYAVRLRSQPSGLGDIVSGLVMIGLSGHVTPMGIPIVIAAGIGGAVVLVATVGASVQSAAVTGPANPTGSGNL